MKFDKKNIKAWIKKFALCRFIIKKIRIIKSVIVNNIKNIFFKYHLKKYFNQKDRKNNKIKVAFLCQMPEIWDKEVPLFESMKKSNDFFVEIIVVPAYDFVNKKIKYFYEKDNFFFQNYSEAIPALINGKWLNLKKRKYDYIFYQRPYNNYLPRGFRSSHVISFAKCCYIPYAFWPLKEMICGYNRDFFDSIYFAFIESEENAAYLRTLGNYDNRVLFCGYPVLENITVTDDYLDDNGVLWTPRWSYGDKIGGSHFFEYKDKILEWQKNNPQMQLIIRPHPLAFENYLAEGLMTEDDIEKYKKSVFSTGAVFDDNKIIETTFKSTRVLISDISSIMYPFFLTGKPIIYCNSGIAHSPSFEILLKGVYIANKWEDVKEYLDKLNSGIDSLKSIREKIIKEIKNKHKDSTNRIVSSILNDYNEHHYI